MPIEEGVIIDSYYVIPEIYGVVSNMASYQYFVLDGHKFIFDDGEYTISDYSLDAEKFNEVFSTEEQFFGEEKIKININEDIVAEMNDIFKISDMRSEDESQINRYFSHGNKIYFNFGNVLICKDITESVISTDLFTLKLMYNVMSKNNGYECYMKMFTDASDNKMFAMISDYFYIEGRIVKFDEDDIKILTGIFGDIEESEDKGFDLTPKIEFFNFLTAIFDFDPQAGISFSGDIATIRSQVIPSAYFKLAKDLGYDVKEENETILEYATQEEVNAIEGIETKEVIKIHHTVPVTSLYSVSKFVISKRKDMSEIEMNIIKTGYGTFIYHDGEIKILITISER
jgi:hypothetical protein